MVKDAQNDIKAKVDETSAEFLELVKERITNLSTLWNNLTISNPVVKDRCAEPTISSTTGLTDGNNYDFFD